ncbi:DNA-binding protein [Streptomyces sp. ND04-05B]|uniref:DNA-binding protein n=1 Tax=Streptomyces sp. ND04-05B TaxID=3028693 RepID=UPI0029AC252C|nr:DNA-binding protein [Streptomyces sp. ND04-05B]MDX3067096.1 DNA-binding protein [Streptomyces sp. ND04-05B]
MTKRPRNEEPDLTVGDLLKLPPTINVETAGRAFGISRRKAYELVRSGNFPCEVIKVGAERVGYKVVTADLHRVLGIRQVAEQAPAA